MTTSADEASVLDAPVPPTVGPIDPLAFYDTEALAALLGVTVQSLHNRRHEGRRMPAGAIVGRGWLYSGQAIIDYLAGGSHRTSGTKLTPDDVRVIRRRLAAGEMQRTIADDFGVTIGTISHIRTGRLWASVQ